MYKGRSAIIFFSTGASKEDFFNDVLRRETLNRGVESILSNVEGIRIVRANDFSCTASVAGNSDAILRLKQFVDQTELGSVEFDAFEVPAFRAAGGE